MPPKVAKKKPAASANATSTANARKPKSSLSSTTTKKISPPVSSLPGRPVTKQPRRTMNSASSSFDFSAFDDVPSQSTTDQQQQKEEGQEGTTEFGSDSGFRGEEEENENENDEVDGNLSPTHEAFYPFPLPPNLHENEDLPSNSVGYQVPQLNLEPPTPAKIDSEKPVKVVETSPEPSEDTIAPQRNASSDEQVGAATAVATTVESQQNEDVTMEPVPKEEIKSEDMEQDSNPTAQVSSIASEAALQAESLVPPSSPLSDAPPSSSRAGLDDQPSQEADVSSSEMQVDPIKTEEEDSKPPVLQEEVSSSPTNVPDAATPAANAIKDEMLQSLLSAIGQGKEKEKESQNENPVAPSSEDVVDEVDQMDPDFWEVEKRPSQKKMEEVRRINATRDWDKECDEMLGYERAEKERRQNEWQNQKSIRVRAEEKREMDREKGIFTPEDHYDRYEDVGSGKRGGRGRGRGMDRDRGSSKRGRGGGPPPRDPRGFVPRGDSPPRFPYSSATQIPPPSASYQPVAQPQSSSQFNSNALASLTSQFATDDAKAKLAALQAQISAQPDLFNSLLAKIAAPAPAPAANDGYGSNPYPQSQSSSSYYQQPPTGSSIPVTNHQSYSSPDPYGRNERAPLPPQSSLATDPYARGQGSRDPRDACRSTTNDYRNNTSRFPSQDPYARARSPTSTYQTNGTHLDPYGRIGSNNSVRDPYSSNPMLSSSSPSRPYSPNPNPNVGQYSSPIPNQGSDPYSNRNPNPYDRNQGMNDPYRAPPPPSSASVNGWGAPPPPPQSSNLDPYSRGHPGPPPSLPLDNTPAPQVTGYGARSTTAGPSSGRYADAIDRAYRDSVPYHGAPRGRGGRGRESITKRMMM